MNEEPLDAEAPVRRIEVGGDLDRRSAEALALEIRALAKRHGFEIRDVKVTTSLPAEDRQSAE
jgi:hypothetical protein